MDDKQFGRYFFIDTQPLTSDQNKYLPNPPNYHDDESRDYASDHIDEELEHRLYSMADHQYDEHVGPMGDVIKTNQQDKQQQKQQQQQHQPHVQPKSIELVIEGDKPLNDPTPSSKRKKKIQPVSPIMKKVKSTATSTSTTATSSKSSDNQTNLRPSIIYLSDSDEDTGAEEPIVSRNDLWHIDYKDFLISNPIHGKFYRPRIWCSRCRKEGNHPVKLCHLPKYKICYICGGIGHLGQHCFNQHCKRCMDFHSTSKCSLNISEFKCRICHKYGHLDDVCPNHWRKFHNITDPKVDPNLNMNKIEKNTRKCCSICGRHQHFSFECERLRNRPIQVSSPYDISTSYGSGFIPNRALPPKSSYENQQSRLSYTPSSRKSYGRPVSRYFTSESASHSLFDQPNTSSYQPRAEETFFSPPSPPQHTVSKSSPKKKSKIKLNKTKKKKNSSNSNNNTRDFERSTDIDYIKGGSIRSGRVKKSKTKQKQRKKQKKQQVKMEHALMRQSLQSNMKFGTMNSIKKF